MGKRNRNNQPFQPKTRCLAHAQQQRHLARLGLTNAGEYERWCCEHGIESGRNKDWRRRRQERRAAAREQEQRQRAEAACCHIRNLGIRSDEEYAGWCRDHGFAVSSHKSEARRSKERQAAAREQASVILQEAPSRQGAWEAQLDAIVAGHSDISRRPDPALQLWHQAFAEIKCRRKRQALHQLALHVGRKSSLPMLDSGLLNPNLGWGNTYVQALQALARHHSHWIRPAEDWKPCGRTPQARFGSLARHLLARYNVPAFMDCAWFEGNTGQAQTHQQWWIEIGRGHNIRTLNTCITLTKMAAHYCLRAPGDCNFDTALRWGQVRGLGGSERLARAVLSTLLRDIQADEAFWAEFVQWLVNHPDLNPSHVGPIANYIYHVKFAPREAYLPNGEMEFTDPPEPEFEMKGRTPEALLRRVDAWHEELARETAQSAKAWDGLGMAPFAQELPDRTADAILQWTIHELCSSQELEAEGKAMNNCVATYIESCAEGKSSIWSLRIAASANETARRVMTIEVDPETKTIVQARGKCNVVPSEKQASKRLKLAPNLLRQWASQAGLRLSSNAW